MLIKRSIVKDFRQTMEPIDELTSPEGRKAIDLFWENHPGLSANIETIRELQRRAFPLPIGYQIRFSIGTILRRWADRIERDRQSKI